MFDVALIESVRPGDEVEIRKIGRHVVSRLEAYDDETFVLVYFAHGEATYENRARDKSGMNERGGYVVEKSLAPMRAGELVVLERGNTERASLMLATMERQQRERWATAAERMRRAQAREAAAA